MNLFIIQPSFKLFDEVPKKKLSAQNFSKKKVSQVKEFNDLLSNELNSREADFWFHCKKISLFQRNVRLYTV